jgi:hypothetical protein
VASESEAIDSVHSLKSTHRKVKESDDDRLGSFKNESRSSNSSVSSDSGKSGKSDSEPGNPRAEVGFKQKNHLPYSSSQQKPVKSTSF